MSTPVVLRAETSLFQDRRDEGRALRVTWHPREDIFVLSTWRGDACASTFQLTRPDIAALIAALAQGLADTTPLRPVLPDPR